METTNTIAKLHTHIELGMREDYTREQFLKAREQWKKLASNLKEIKNVHKERQREFSAALVLAEKTTPFQGTLWGDVESKCKIQNTIFDAKQHAKWYFRHYHIAYCLAKGTSYGKIEKNPETEPNWQEIKKIIAGFYE